MSDILVGGMGGANAADADSQHIADQVKDAVAHKTGHALTTYEVVGYTTQLVAGMNYFLKIKVGENEAVHARVYKDLKGHVSLHSVQTGKQLSDAIEYF